MAPADGRPLRTTNQLGVDYNARLLGTIAEHVAPAIGWVHPDRRAEERVRG